MESRQSVASNLSDKQQGSTLLSTTNSQSDILFALSIASSTATISGLKGSPMFMPVSRLKSFIHLHINILYSMQAVENLCLSILAILGVAIAPLPSLRRYGCSASMYEGMEYLMHVLWNHFAYVCYNYAVAVGCSQSSCLCHVPQYSPGSDRYRMRYWSTRTTTRRRKGDRWYRRFLVDVDGEGSLLIIS